MLANIFAILATTYFIVNATETERFEERHQQAVEKAANRIVSLYEQGKTGRLASIEEKASHKKPSRRWLPLKILDSDKQVIFDSLPKRMSIKKSIEFDITSESNNSYQILALAGPPPRIIHVLHKLNRVQFIFIVFASIIMSALLSWTISKPLKRLSEYSRRFALDKQSPKLDERLLSRTDEIGILAQDINSMIIAIEKNMSAQKQLLHDVSHELRAPLSRLQVASAILEKNSPDNRQHIERIEKECERINRLIQEILDFSRINQTTYESSLVDLEPLVNEIIEDIQFTHPDRKVQSFIDNKSNTIQAHPELLSRAIENIILNACKHTEPSTPIDVIVKGEEDFTAVMIRDYGQGVKESDLEHLCRFFYRGNNNMHAEGFGLGLSIAKRAVEMCNGKIALRNHPEGGLEVTLTLSSHA